MICKCGHLYDNHLDIKENKIGETFCNICYGKCKKFEAVLREKYNAQHWQNEKQQKGCGMEISIMYICGKNDYLCPDCKLQNHSLNLTINDTPEENLKSVIGSSQTKSASSGFNLTDKIEVWEEDVKNQKTIGEYYWAEDVQEFIRIDDENANKIKEVMKEINDRKLGFSMYHKLAEYLDKKTKLAGNKLK